MLVLDAPAGELKLGLQCNYPQLLPGIRIPLQTVDVLFAQQALIQFPHQALTAVLARLLQGISITLHGIEIPFFISDQLPILRRYNLISSEMALKITRPRPIVSIASLKPGYTLTHRLENGIGKYVITATYKYQDHTLNMDALIATFGPRQRFTQQDGIWFEWPAYSQNLITAIQQARKPGILRPEDVMGFDRRRIERLHPQPVAPNIRLEGTTPAARAQSIFSQLRHHGIPGGIIGEPVGLTGMFITACKHLLRDNRQARILWLAPSNKKGSVTRAVNESTIRSYVTVASLVTLRDTPALISNLLPDDPKFALLVQQKVQDTLRTISNLSNSFDFAYVLTLYWRAYQNGDDIKMEQTIRWLRGEYQSLSEVRANLPVNSMVTDKTWYAYLKLFASFFQLIGYKGLVVFFDEVVNLYKISNSVSRNNNYEQLLTLFNDINQGVAQHLGLIFSGTPQLVEDPKRGLYSYEALRSRLQESRFTQDGRRSFAGPLIRLDPLTNEELFVLMQKIRDIHALHYRYTTTITDRNLQQFMEVVTAQIGSTWQLTPRESTRDLIAIMEIMRRDAAIAFTDIIYKRDFVVSRQQENPDVLTPQNEIIDDDASFARFTL